jgi:hypothetical protein
VSASERSGYGVARCGEEREVRREGSVGVIIGNMRCGDEKRWYMCVQEKTPEFCERVGWYRVSGGKSKVRVDDGVLGWTDGDGLMMRRQCGSVVVCVCSEWS